MTKQIDLDKYTEFVNAVTSEESKYGGHFQDRLKAVSYTHLTLPTSDLV